MSTYSSIVLGTAGLLYYWQLNETTGTSATDFKGANTGTYHGGFTLNQTTANGLGTSVAFNGSNTYLSEGTIINLPTLSFEIWVYPTAVPTANNLIMGLCGSDTLTYSFVLALNSSLSPLAYAYDTTPHQFTSNVPLILNAWNHVVMTGLASSALTLYVNGVSAGSATLVATIQTGYTIPNLFVGGGASLGFPGFFTGKLDEAAVYNVALSAATVKAHYYQIMSFATPSCQSAITAQGIKVKAAQARFVSGSASMCEGTITRNAQASPICQSTVADTSTLTMPTWECIQTGRSGRYRSRLTI
jgi:trimeric autotransporter adhesin